MLSFLYKSLSVSKTIFFTISDCWSAIRDAIGSDEFNRLSRAGIVASLSGMNEYE
nr:MAG TPA: hypothetical protein [Ackermannviridae sp.]